MNLRGWMAVLCCMAACQGACAAVPLAMLEAAPGVFVHAGAQADSSAENHGDIANIGFIVGARCAAVVDTGGSRALGERLLAALRARTSLPVCYVINTHVHPDHVLGNAAFADLPEAPRFVAHAKLAAALAARGRTYLPLVERQLGAEAAGTRIVPPQIEVKDRLALDLGERKLELRAWRASHTDNDLTVFDAASGTLWASDLLFVARTPVLDGNLRGWLKTMDELEALNPRMVIAGHGEAGADWRPAFAAQRRYLKDLADETLAAIRARRPISAAVSEVVRGERANWLLFDDFHPRNVTAAYAELEWED